MCLCQAVEAGRQELEDSKSAKEWSASWNGKIALLSGRRPVLLMFPGERPMGERHEAHQAKPDGEMA